MVRLSLLMFLLFANKNSQATDATFNTVKEKLEAYSHLAATSIFHWNTQSEISNSAITSMITRSGLQEDNSGEGVIFRHILATSTANEINGKRIPLYVKQPLLERHWVALKSSNPKLFAATKSYYIYATAVNQFDGTKDRVSITVPALKRLKDEVIRTGDHQATAISSIWLAMELMLGNPFQAISEIEYALPFLPERSEHKTLENYLSKETAHDWLRRSYQELTIPSLSFYHAMEILDLQKPSDVANSWAYFTAIDALIDQFKFEEALLLSDKAIETVGINNTEHEMYLILTQRLRVIAFQQGENFAEQAEQIYRRLSKLGVEEVAKKSQELVAYSKALYLATTPNKREFINAVQHYTNVLDKMLLESGFKDKIKLRKELELSKLYEVSGDYQASSKHYKRYKKLLVTRNAEQFENANIIKADNISEDIELAKFRQQELEALRNERMGLNHDNGQLQSTVLLLITAILSMLAMWLWVNKQRDNTQVKYNELTGSLTRSAMLRSLTVALKKDHASCMALVNIDHFQRINDTYGYQVGEEVVSVLGKTIQKRIRKTDKFCRFGNEEFLIYFSNSNEDEVKHILNELNGLLAKQKWWKNTEQSFSTSFSSGVLTLNGEDNLDHVLKYCHRLLESTKSKGDAAAITQSISPV